MPSHEFEGFEDWVNHARKMLARASGEDGKSGVLLAAYSDDDGYYTTLHGNANFSDVTDAFAAIVRMYISKAVESGREPTSALFIGVGMGMDFFHREEVDGAG